MPQQLSPPAATPPITVTLLPPAPAPSFVVIPLPPPTYSSAYPPNYPPNYPAISKPVSYECVSSNGGKVLGVISTTGGLRSATAACNHRINACIIDYDSSGNNDGNYGSDGGCIAQIQGELSDEEDQHDRMVTNKLRGGELMKCFNTCEAGTRGLLALIMDMEVLP